jgi:hypothetical protein
MGALTTPVVYRGVQVVSGDVVRFVPTGWRRLLPWRNGPFLAIVDVRDRSVPYFVHRKGDRVWKVPLVGAFERCEFTVYRLPGVDRATGSQVAAAAAERPGEGVHHPSYDCARTSPSDEALVADAFRAARVAVDSSMDPLREVRGPQDPPNRVIGVDEAAAPHPEGKAFVDRGIAKSLPWQRRSRR